MRDDELGGGWILSRWRPDSPCIMLSDMEMIAPIPDPLLVGRQRRNPVSGAARRRASTIAYYEDHAEEYAATTMAIDTAERVSRFAALLPKGAHVLDAGCGAGRDLIALNRTGLCAQGLDISPALVSIARRNSRLPVRVGDLRTPPFAPCSFDGVWAMASLLHIEPDEIREALGALMDVLAPGGILFASVKRGRGLARDADGRWFSLQDEDGWRHHLCAAGFEVLEIVGEPAAAGGATSTVAPGWIASLARRPM